MITTVAIMFNLQLGLFYNTETYIAAYKDLDTCIKRIEVLAKTEPSLKRTRYCNLVGIINDYKVGYE